MRDRKRFPRHEGIEYVEGDGFRGWIVLYWKNGKDRMRRFDSEEFGGSSAAFTAAARFVSRMASGEPAARPRKSRTGLPGIRKGKVLTSAGRNVQHYAASWYDADGKRVGRTFSWLKYGKERALELAIQARKKGLEETERIRRSRKKRKRAAPKASGKSVLRSARRTAHENVSRVDHNDFHGYVVQVKRIGARHGKYFNDEPDGRRAALAAAIRYRDALLTALPAPVKIHRRSSNNSTGVIGVSLVRERTRSGTWSERFVAMWHTVDGKRRKASFSTAKYGFARAKEMAIRARQEGVAKLFEDRKAALLAEIDEGNRRRAHRRRGP